MTTKSVAVVTGANRGLGLETCRQLADRGYRVLVTARQAAAGEAAAESLRRQGLDVLFHPLDVDDAASVDALAAYVGGEFGHVDAVVNNAGIFPDGSPTKASSAFDTEEALLLAGFSTNTMGPWRVCRALIPLMQGRGCIVNVSSGMGQLTR